MKKVRKFAKAPSAETIAKLADQGRNISGYFTNQGKMMSPIRRVNVDFTQDMLSELDQAAGELNISRQAVIKAFLRQALDKHYVAQRARRKLAAG